MSSNVGVRTRRRTISICFMLLFTGFLSTIPVASADTSNSSSTAWILGIGYDYEWVCYDDSACDSGNYGSGSDRFDYWKLYGEVGDYFVVTVYNYCDPDDPWVGLMYYTPGVGWDEQQLADCYESKQVSRTVDSGTYGTYYFQVEALDCDFWCNEGTDYYIHLYLDTTNRDTDRDGYIDTNDDCPDTYGTSDQGSYFGCRDGDGDGWADQDDDFPNDASEHRDYDGDGVGDNADDFPYDSSETTDSDDDGVGDNADDFPTDSDEQYDSDNDGVGDNADDFPYDSSETTDSDDDGVGDNADEFPLDSSEWLDSDGDGTGNNADPTPYGDEEVEDADEDGIADDDDQCPGTSLGASVDVNGCSSDQRDTDGDGVSDASDNCPNTPTGQQVNSAGCSQSQSDSDGDGVDDSRDSCSNTPNGQSVDSNGCSSSQRDSDNDGVSDNIDACPSTPSGDEVDSSGCTVELDPYDLVMDYAPMLLMDARECYLPIDRHWDDMFVENNRENYRDGRVDSQLCSNPLWDNSYDFGASHDYTAYTHIVESQNHYVFQYWYYYADSNSYMSDSVWVPGSWHEHDYEWVFVWVDKQSLDPFYMALSQHHWINEYFISSTSQIWAQVEIGGHGMIHNTASVIDYAKGDGITINPSGQTFLKLASTINTGDLTNSFFKGDSCYTDYQCKAPWLQPVYSNPDGEIYNYGPKGDYEHDRALGSFWSWINSPVEHYVIDQNGLRTGTIDGTIVEEIPYSYFDLENEAIIILGTGEEDNFRVVINGLEDGTYGLNIVQVYGEDIAVFNATAIPVDGNQLHAYDLGFQEYLDGNNGLTMYIDSQKDGTFERTLTFDGSIIGEDLEERSQNFVISDNVLIAGISAIVVLFLIHSMTVIVRSKNEAKPDQITPPDLASKSSTEDILNNCSVCGQPNPDDATECIYCWANI